MVAICVLTIITFSVFIMFIIVIIRPVQFSFQFHILRFQSLRSSRTVPSKQTECLINTYNWCIYIYICTYIIYIYILCIIYIYIHTYIHTYLHTYILLEMPKHVAHDLKSPTPTRPRSQVFWTLLLLLLSLVSCYYYY